MAQVSILNLPVAISLDGAEYLPIVQGDTTKRAQASLITGFAAGTNAQAANTVLAGPSAAPATAPTFRALVSADLPTVPATKGGTGITSFTTGDLLFASSSTTLARLADIATGNALISGGVGVTPSWGKIGLATHVSGTLPTANGGTGITSLGSGVATWLGTPSSANLAAAVTDETGSGALVFATSPTLVTPVLGTPASGTLTNCNGLPISSGVAGLGTGVATFLATPTSANLAAAVTNETGTGALVFANSPTLVTPLLGTPTSGTLSNCTGLPIGSGVSGMGTGVATFLITPSSANLLAAMTTSTGAGNIVFSTSPTLTTPILGTPTSGTLTNCTGLPISTGVSGLAAGIATFLATPSSANLASAVSDETGSGALVFANTPTLVTPNIGAATGTSLAATGLIKSSSPTAGVGYATGAGGTVTQSTDKSTGVTLNTASGTITLNNASLNANTGVSFTWTNSAITTSSVVQIQHDSVGTLGAYNINITPGSGSATVNVRNITAGSLGEAIVLRFNVWGGATA